MVIYHISDSFAITFILPTLFQQIIAVLCLVGIVASQTVPATKVVSSSTQVNAAVPSMQQQFMKAQTVQVKTQQTTKKGCVCNITLL